MSRPPIIAVLCCLPVAAGTDDSFLLRGATIHTVSGADVPNGAVLVRDGRIVEVGARIRRPKGVRVIESKGLHVYPGMIDSATTIGLTEIGSVRETIDVSELGDYNPQLRAVVAINPASEHIPVTRANGITTVVSTPEGGVISGQAALIHLDGWTWEEMEVLRSAAMALQFPVIRVRISPSIPPERRVPYREARKKYEAQLRDLHDFFEQARRYQKAKAAAGADFRSDVKLEAVLPVLERKLPVLVTAVRERAIREALRFAERERIRLILASAREAWKVAVELKAKDIPVILPPTLALPLHEDDPYDKSFTLPLELDRAGVKFAFATFSYRLSHNLPYQAAAAVAFGLPYQEALKAVTLYPAEIWGVADQIGSIDAGKWADLIVTDGDPLETQTQIKQVFIKGREVDLNNKHKLLYEKYRNRP
jgi:imidazolonepropionase-like amidohydrolase